MPEGDVLQGGDALGANVAGLAGEVLREDRRITSYNVCYTKLLRTCQQFEALFIQSMFKTMRDSVPEGGVIEKGNADGIYQSLFDQEVATQAARHNGIGIADMLYEQLSRDGEDE